jgi:hypothetical protein
MHADDLHPALVVSTDTGSSVVRTPCMPISREHHPVRLPRCVGAWTWSLNPSYLFICYGGEVCVVLQQSVVHRTRRIALSFVAALPGDKGRPVAWRRWHVMTVALIGNWWPTRDRRFPGPCGPSRSASGDRSCHRSLYGSRSVLPRDCGLLTRHRPRSCPLSPNRTPGS